MYGAGAAWSRLFLPGAGADPSRLEPESAPGPWPPGAGAGAAQKSGGSATPFSRLVYLLDPDPNKLIICKFFCLIYRRLVSVLRQIDQAAKGSSSGHSQVGPRCYAVDWYSWDHEERSSGYLPQNP